MKKICEIKKKMLIQLVLLINNLRNTSIKGVSGCFIRFYYQFF